MFDDEIEVVIGGIYRYMFVCVKYDGCCFKVEESEALRLVLLGRLSVEVFIL